MKTKVGELVQKGREEQNLSMRQLAELAKVSHSDISRIESGEREVGQLVQNRPFIRLYLHRFVAILHCSATLLQCNLRGCKQCNYTS